MSSQKTKATRRRRKPTVLSEMVTRRARDTAALVASIRVHKADVGATLNERFAPALLAGETVPDWELTLELAGRCVQLAFDHLDELDDRHFLAKSARAHHAIELDRLAKRELYPQAVAVRRQIDDAFGREAGSDLHTFTGKTPRTPARLRKHAERAVSRLGNPDRLLPPRKVAGESLDRACHPGGGQMEHWKRRLQAPLRQLAAVDEQLSQAKAELNAVAGRRKLAMKHFDVVYAESLRLVEAAYLMAGIRGARVKSLRPYAERRRLARWARKKREARNAGQPALPPAGQGAASARTRDRRRLPKAAFATVSRWLKRNLAFG